MWFDRGVDPDAVRLAIGFASIAAVVWSILAGGIAFVLQQSRARGVVAYTSPYRGAVVVRPPLPNALVGWAVFGWVVVLVSLLQRVPYQVLVTREIGGPFMVVLAAVVASELAVCIGLLVAILRRSPGVVGTAVALCVVSLARALGEVGVVAHVGVLDPEILAFQPFLVLHLVFGLGVIRAVAPRTS